MTKLYVIEYCPKKGKPSPCYDERTGSAVASINRTVAVKMLRYWSESDPKSLYKVTTYQRVEK
jgi:hypothetical protein